MSIISLFFSAKGRIRRRDWWLASIGMGIFLVAVEYAGHQLITGNPPSQFFTDLAGWVKFQPTPFNIFLIAIMAISTWPGICLSAKRWHDRGRSGWLAGALLAASYILLFVQQIFGPQQTDSIDGVNWPIYGGASLISLGLGIWQFVELGCLDGTKGPNAYGPSPKGSGTSADVF